MAMAVYSKDFEEREDLIKYLDSRSFRVQAAPGKFEKKSVGPARFGGRKSNGWISDTVFRKACRLQVAVRAHPSSNFSSSPDTPHIACPLKVQPKTWPLPFFGISKRKNRFF